MVQLLDMKKDWIEFERSQLISTNIEANAKRGWSLILSQKILWAESSIEC